MLAPLLFLALAADLNGVWTGQGLTVTLNGATGSEQISDKTFHIRNAALEGETLTWTSDVPAGGRLRSVSRKATLVHSEIHMGAGAQELILKPPHPRPNRPASSVSPPPSVSGAPFVSSTPTPPPSPSIGTLHSPPPSPSSKTNPLPRALPLFSNPSTTPRPGCSPPLKPNPSPRTAALGPLLCRLGRHPCASALRHEPAPGSACRDPNRRTCLGQIRNSNRRPVRRRPTHPRIHRNS